MSWFSPSWEPMRQAAPMFALPLCPSLKMTLKAPEALVLGVTVVLH